MAKNTKQKYDDQTRDLYRAYGQFAVQFEQLCRNMKLCIIFTMHSNGLKNQDLIRILLADQTAYPLISKLRGFVAIVYKDDKHELNHLEPLFKFCISVNEQRNEIIHGTWYIGWPSQGQTEFNIASGSKDKITKKGIELNSYSWEPKTFDELTEKTKIAADLLHRLISCMSYGHLPSKTIDAKSLEKLK